MQEDVEAGIERIVHRSTKIGRQERYLNLKYYLTIKASEKVSHFPGLQNLRSRVF